VSSGNLSLPVWEDTPLLEDTLLPLLLKRASAVENMPSPPSPCYTRALAEEPPYLTVKLTAEPHIQGPGSQGYVKAHEQTGPNMRVLTYEQAMLPLTLQLSPLPESSPPPTLSLPPPRRAARPATTCKHSQPTQQKSPTPVSSDG
jgi:hypothetical protein